MYLNSPKPVAATERYNQAKKITLSSIFIIVYTKLFEGIVVSLTINTRLIFTKSLNRFLLLKLLLVDLSGVCRYT